MARRFTFGFNFDQKVAEASTRAVTVRFMRLLQFEIRRVKHYFALTLL